MALQAPPVARPLIPSAPLPYPSNLHPQTTTSTTLHSFRFIWLLSVMGCIPSRQNILEKFDEHGHGRSTLKGMTSETKHPKRPKYKAQSRRPPSPPIPEDAPPWVNGGHTVMTVHRDPRSGEVYLTEKCR